MRPAVARSWMVATTPTTSRIVIQPAAAKKTIVCNWNLLHNIMETPFSAICRRTLGGRGGPRPGRSRPGRV